MAVSSPTRVEPPRGRTDIGGMGPPPTPPPPTRRAESPSLSPGNGNLATPGNNGRGAWLSDLLTRASQDGESPIRDPSVREPPTRDSLREPTPETPRFEPEIIPPTHRTGRPDAWSGAEKIYVRQATFRAPGPLGIILVLLAVGLIASVILLLIVGALLGSILNEVLSPILPVLRRSAGGGLSPSTLSLLLE